MALQSLYGILVLCFVAWIHIDGLRFEPTSGDWDSAYRDCQNQGYMMVPGRSFRAKGLLKIMQEGQSVWINGWRSVAQLEPDSSGRVETFKLDFSRPLKKAMFVACQDASGSYVVSNSKTLAEQSEVQCYAEGYMPAVVNTVWDYISLQEALKSSSPHWVSKVTPPRGGKQCLRAEKTESSIEYTYDDCNRQLNYICLDDESVIASFLPLIVIKDTDYSEVVGVVDEIKAMKISSSSEVVPESSSSEYIEPSSSMYSSSDIIASSSSIKPILSEAAVSSTDAMSDVDISISTVSSISPESTSSALMTPVIPSESSSSIIAPTSSDYAMETSMYEPNTSSSTESSSSSIVPSSSSSLYVVDIIPSESSSGEKYIVASTPSPFDSSTSSSSFVAPYVPQTSLGSDMVESPYVIDVVPMISTPIESSSKRPHILVNKSDMPPEFSPTLSSSDDFLSSSSIYYQPDTDDNMYTLEETTHQAVTIIETTDMNESDTTSDDYYMYRTTTEDTVDASIDENLDITTPAEETNDSNDPQSKQSTANAGMDTSMIVAFVLLVIAVFISILIAIVLYRRRKMQKSKDITTTAENGKAAPPAPAITPLPTGDTPATEVELRDKRSTSKERESATYRDTAYDL